MELVKDQIKMAHKAASLEKQEQYYLRIGKQVQDANAELQKLSVQAEKLQSERIEKQDSYEQEMLKENQREQAVRNVHQLEQVKEAVMTFASLKAQVTLDEKEWRTSKGLREKMFRNIWQSKRKQRESLMKKQKRKKRRFFIVKRKSKRKEMINR